VLHILIPQIQYSYCDLGT